MPVIAATEPRKRLALAALGLPILGMMGLFAWAGTQSGNSPVAAVNSFISAYDAGQCHAMQAVMYKASGTAGTTCAQLKGSASHPLLDCKLTLQPASSASKVTAPSGYGDVQMVLADCLQKTSATAKKPSAEALDFYVASNTSSGQVEILGVELAGT